jgi:arsenate reductase
MRLYRVLFVCIGNSCRSQMAEAFAARYGAGVLIARSAGLAPCEMVAPVTREVMQEKGIDLDGAVPKGLELTGTNYDLIVNMSGRPLPRQVTAEVREWDVEDPIWVSKDRHREIRDQIEGLVRELIAELSRRRGVRARI